MCVSERQRQRERERERCNEEKLYTVKEEMDESG